METQNTTLFTKSATGRYHLATQAEVLTVASEIMMSRYDRETVLNGPDHTRAFLKAWLQKFEREVFAIIFLDARHRVIAREEMFYGTIDGASVHPREVLKAALRHNAAAVILAHNHPSGVAEPSHADRAITLRLRDALALVDVRVLDHFVVGANEVVSFAERGLI